MSSSAAISPAPPRREWPRQVALYGAAYILYSAARWVSVGDLDVATRHAHWVVHLERAARVNVELAVQRSLTGTPLMWLLNHVYVMAQLVVVPGALVWLYRRGRGTYRVLRNTVLGTWLVALPVYAAFPVAPPRLAHIGMVDTISKHTGIALNSSMTTVFYNPLAAVPSLHVGFAFAVGIALAAASRSRWSRVLWLAWGPLVTLTVVATGNHFIFDVIAGLCATALGYCIGAAGAKTMDSIVAAARSRSFRLKRPQAARESALRLSEHASAQAASAR
jgi:membrane-associated phospholipid phosphatase